MCTDSRCLALDVESRLMRRYSACATRCRLSLQLCYFRAAVLLHALSSSQHIVAVSVCVCATAAACDAEPLAAAVNSVYDAGILSAAAAGNAANSSALLLPACASKAVSVGAVFFKTDTSAGFSVCSDAPAVEDNVVCFSNR